MVADIYTKEFVERGNWYKLCRQVGIYSPEDIAAGDLLSFFLSATALRSIQLRQGPSS
jgi:hypothetical protein